MANFWYTHAKALLLQGQLNLAGDDIRVALVMTNTTADTEKDVDTIGAFITLDEFDGAGYASPGIALGSETVTEDEPNDRAEFDAANAVFSGIDPGTRQIAGALIYKFVTNLGLSIPIAFCDDNAPYTPGGGDIEYNWNAEGILQAT